MIFIKNPRDATSFRIYIDDIGTATVSSATAPATVDGLTIGTIATDNATTPKSVIVPVSGGDHGDNVQIPITFNLSTGGPLERPIVVRVWAS